MNDRIHLNNAGASLVSDATLSKMVSFLELEQKIGGYEAASQCLEDIERFYSVVARLIGCEKEQVAFSESATRAWNTLIFSLEMKRGDRIVTTSTEFGSNVVSLQSVAEKVGADLVVLDVQDDGLIDISELEKYIDGNLRLVALSHAPAHCGSVINAAEIGQRLRGSQALYLLDACQTLGQFPLSVADIGCDALVATGRKWLRGPRGTGFLYANDRVLSSAKSIAVDLANADWLSEPKDGSQVSFFKKAQRFQTWERSLAGQIGLTNAIDEYLEKTSETSVTDAIQRLRSLAAEAVRSNSKLVEYPGGNAGSGVFTFYSRSVEAGDIKNTLSKNNVNVSLMSDWDAPWDFAAKKLPTLVRVSPHYINSQSDLDVFSQVASEI